jgi:hypothetical protein
VLCAPFRLGDRIQFGFTVGDCRALDRG